MFRALLVSALLGFAAASIECQSCTWATAELLKSNPVLGKPEKRDGDRALALGDALPSMCLSNVFKGLTDADKLTEACKSFSGAEGAVAKAILSGDAASACSAACEGVEEAQRTPAAAAHKPSKGPAKKDKEGKKEARKGTVDDPAYKAALKAKAKRDAERAKRKGKKDDGEEFASEEL